MFITIINDCKDSNAEGRQATRVASLFGVAPSFVGVGTDLEAAGNLIDVLDAGDGKEGIVLVNVAPRGGAAKKWPNGTPFGYFRHRQTLVVASIDGLTLSLVKKLRLTDRVCVLDIPTVLADLVGRGLITNEERRRVSATQFRSFEFLPRAARWLWDGTQLPHESAPISEFPDALPAVWFVDNFGNCKTTILEEEAGASATPSVSLGGSLIPRHERLKDVPDATPAIIVGSSGLGRKRFFEIVIQGGNASRRFGLASGDRVNYFSCTVPALKVH